MNTIMALALHVRRVFQRLVRRPGLTVILVVLIALGLSVATAVSRVYMTILRPTPFHEPQRLYSVISIPRAGGDPQRAVSPGDYRILEEIAPSLGVVSGYLLFSRPLRIDDEDLNVSVAAVSASFFEALKMPVLIGRTFAAKEDRLGDEPVAVISETVWRRLFHSSPQALDRMVHLGDRTYRVIGVVPGRYVFPHGVGIWIPLNPEAAPLWRIRNVPIMGAILRAKDSESASSVAANLARLGANAWAELRPVPLNAYLTERVKGPALILFGAGLLLLSLCVASMAGLQTAAALGRRRDLAIEQSLGLSPSMLWFQFLVEGLAVGVCGWLFGRLMADTCSARLASFLPSADFALSSSVSETTILFASFFAVLLIAGVSAVATFVDVRSNFLLSRELTAATTRGKRIAWSGLVCFQVAVSVAFLAVGAVLLLDYFRLTRREVGFSPGNVVTFELRFSGGGAAPNTRSSEIQEIEDSLRERLGGIQVGLSSMLPGSGQINLAHVRLGAAEPARQADLRIVGGEYFDLLGIRLVKGRKLARSDASHAPLVALIDETAARAWFGSEDPLGREILIGAANQALAVVGVVMPVRQDVYADPYPTVYLSQTQFPWPQMHFLLKAVRDQNLDRLLHNAPKLAKSINQRVLADKLMTLEAALDAGFFHRRARLVVVVLFGVIAVLIAVMGVYTLVSTRILDRRVEVGVRLALGATDNSVLRLLLARVGFLVITGIFCGAAATAALGVTVASVIPEFAGVNVWSLSASVGLISMAVLPAVIVPVRRLVRRGPSALLREI